MGIDAARLNPSYELCPMDDQAVGWVERSDTHQFAVAGPYSLLFSSAARSAKALWVDFGPWGLAVELSAKYC